MPAAAASARATASCSTLSFSFCSSDMKRRCGQQGQQRWVRRCRSFTAPSSFTELGHLALFEKVDKRRHVEQRTGLST
jgi:hypothetical protein